MLSCFSYIPFMNKILQIKNKSSLRHLTNSIFQDLKEAVELLTNLTVNHFIAIKPTGLIGSTTFMGIRVKNVMEIFSIFEEARLPVQAVLMKIAGKIIKDLSRCYLTVLVQRGLCIFSSL